MKATLKLVLAAGFLAGSLTGLATVPASAHGEKAQAPFLRMRTIQWYDVEWTKKEFAVNEHMKLKGKIHVMSEDHWPQTVPKPDLVFLNVGVPGPVVVRTASYLNGVNMSNSTVLQLGRDYAFEVDLKGRKPYDMHLHTELNIAKAGPLVGPGKYVTITGNEADYSNKVTTLDGRTVELETFGLSGIISWHIIWAVIAFAWLLYWLRKPLFFERWEYVKVGRGSELITRTDRAVAVAAVAIGFGLSIFGFAKSFWDYPVQLPLQAAMAYVDPMPLPEEKIAVKYLGARYKVPGRSMEMDLQITNGSTTPVVLGEFNTATVRFINPKVGFKDNITKDYPENLLAPDGLSVSDDSPIAPGETRKVHVVAQDAAWEVENLSALIYDPDSAFAGLLFFYGNDGSRHIVETGGTLVPDFVMAKHMAPAH